MNFFSFFSGSFLQRDWVDQSHRVGGTKDWTAVQGSFSSWRERKKRRLDRPCQDRLDSFGVDVAEERRKKRKNTSLLVGLFSFFISILYLFQVLFFLTGFSQQRCCHSCPIFFPYSISYFVAAAVAAVARLNDVRTYSRYRSCFLLSRCVWWCGCAKKKEKKSPVRFSPLEMESYGRFEHWWTGTKKTEKTQRNDMCQCIKDVVCTVVRARPIGW